MKSTSSKSLELPTLGRVRQQAMVVDLGLSCPSCRVHLTLPSAFLGQVVTGPCPKCGTTLVFCHGRIENATGADPGMEVLEAERGGAPRTKLSRTGTVGVHYLDELVIADGGEAKWGMAEGEAPGLSSTAGVPAARPAGWLWVAGLAVLALTAATVWQASQPLPSLPEPQPAAPGVATGARVIPAGWDEGALAAWKAFVNGSTVEEKLAHVLDSERVAPAMRAYYAARPDVDAEWAGRVFKPLPGTPEDRRRGLMVLGFSPASSEERPMILFMRTRPPGRDGASEEAASTPRFLLDWETFVQERDRLVEGFLKDESSPRRTFRVAVERTHVFSDSAVSSGGREALGFRMRTPSGLSLPRVVSLPADSPLHARLESQLRWGMTAYATLQLSWDRVIGPTPQVIVSDFVCWHFPGLGGQPEFEADLCPLPPGSMPLVTAQTSAR